MVKVWTQLNDAASSSYNIRQTNQICTTVRFIHTHVYICNEWWDSSYRRHVDLSNVNFNKIDEAISYMYRGFDNVNILL